jgi:phosphoglycerate dehydrogenase-like enzyme
VNGLRIFVDIEMPPDARELLHAGTAGHELIFSRTPATSILTVAERDSEFATADVAFGQPDPQAIAGAGRLRWVHVSSAGLTRYDHPEFRALAARREIAVTNSSSVFAAPCAVHVLSFMLAQARKLPFALKTRTAWGSRPWLALRAASTTLRGETVLIVGHGAIGKRLVELLQPFGMKIIGYRRRPRGDESVAVIAEDQLATVLGEADHIVNILPASAETLRFFNRARFEAAKPGAIFYNLGRGTTVDQDALLAALRSARLGAAWLDVTEPEPLPDEHPLLTQPNCFITPHVAGGHADEFKMLVRHFLENLNRFVRGEPLLDRVM